MADDPQIGVEVVQPVIVVEVGNGGVDSVTVQVPDDAEADVVEILVPGPIGERGPPGEAVYASDPDIPDLVVLFENRLV